MLKTTIGLDWDYVPIKTAKKRMKQIEKELNCQSILYKTKRGVHLILIFNKFISKEKNFELREKYQDCPERIRRSLLRSETPGVPHDILFSIKNGHWRERIW